MSENAAAAPCPSGRVKKASTCRRLPLKRRRPLPPRLIALFPALRVAVLLQTACHIAAAYYARAFRMAAPLQDGACFHFHTPQTDGAEVRGFYLSVLPRPFFDPFRRHPPRFSVSGAPSSAFVRRFSSRAAARRRRYFSRVAAPPRRWRTARCSSMTVCTRS